MKALILDGTTRDSTENALCPLLDALKDRGLEAQVFRLEEMNIRHCTGCFNCWAMTPGRCSIRDDAEAVLRAELGCGLLVFVSPIRWGSYSPVMKRMIERSIPVLLPFFSSYQGEVHHTMRYSRQPGFMAVGISSGPGSEEESVFRELVGRNLLNFQSPAAGIAVLDRSRPQEHLGRIKACLEGMGLEGRP